MADPQRFNPIMDPRQADPRFRRPTAGRRPSPLGDLFGNPQTGTPLRGMGEMQTGSTGGPTIFQQVIERIRDAQQAQPNLLQRVGNNVNPNILQRVGRQVNPQINSAIDTALNIRKGTTTGQNPLAPQAQNQPALPAFNEFARRAQLAKARGLKPADTRFSNLSDSQLSTLANPAGDEATPQISESGQRLGLETGQQFDDSWLNEISTEYALEAWNDPQTAARIVLQANGIREDSAFGDYWLDLANTLPDLYRQQAASEPGTVAVDGSDYLAFSQGVFENLMSPAGSEEAQATLESMNDFGAAQLNAIFNDPTSEISQRVQAAYDEARQYGKEADTLYQMAVAPAIRNYSSIDKQVIGSMYQKHFEQYQMKQATGYSGSFLDYLRDDTDFLNQIT